MKKYIRVLGLLVILFIIVELLFFFFYRGKEVQYQISNNDNEYDVYENYVRNKKDSYYYLEIKLLDNVFNMSIPSIYKKDSYIIKDIYSYSDDNYTCILPIFIGGSIQTDILCRKVDDDIIYPYQSIKNNSLNLDRFALSMGKYGYLSVSKNEVTQSKYGISIYDKSPFVIIPSYRGIYIIDDNISMIDLFDKDVYKQKIQGVIGKYYVVADYDESYSFHEFKVVDLETKSITKIYSDSSISMNSYVQGIVGNSIYIMDSSNRKQYCLDMDKMSIDLIGNSKKGILYYNGTEFETRNIYDALDNELLFDISISDDKYDSVYLNNHTYYSYKKMDDGYDIYISYVDNPSIYTYGYSVSSLERIQYTSGCVYYIEGDTLYSYGSKNGVSKVLSYKEFYYNPNLNFWIYEK